MSPPPAPADPTATRAVAIVPARLQSTRMERKMLRRDTGRYLFEHTVRNAERARSLSGVWLATDSAEILAAAAEVGIRAIRTGEHPSGTDRVREAATRLEEQGLGPLDVVVNVQGDEPELSPEALDALVSTFVDPEVEVATLATPIASPKDLESPNVVKLVRAANGDALYFSRAAVPAAPPESGAARGDLAPPLRHVGVYAFRREALERFCRLETGRLERTERLEQLRWLEAGGRIRVVEVAEVPRDINTEEQYAEFRAGFERAGRSVTRSGERSGT